jgi:Ser/Thr protein kinase RdoA (MazF antagonist)
VKEEPLTTDDKRLIVRTGDKVRRPAHWWTPAVHDLLSYLASVGFSYSPRVFGVDSDGREVLSHIAGESGKNGWVKIVSDEGLREFARLLRAYHDAVAAYTPAIGLEWATGATSVKPGEIICHGDFGPWNIVWRGTDPVAIIDWDLAHPALPEGDILYALEYAVPFGTMKQPSDGTTSRKCPIGIIASRSFWRPMEPIPYPI